MTQNTYDNSYSLLKEAIIRRSITFLQNPLCSSMQNFRTPPKKEKKEKTVRKHLKRYKEANQRYEGVVHPSVVCAR